MYHHARSSSKSSRPRFISTLSDLEIRLIPPVSQSGKTLQAHAHRTETEGKSLPLLAREGAMQVEVVLSPGDDRSHHRPFQRLHHLVLMLTPLEREKETVVEVDGSLPLIFIPSIKDHPEKMGDDAGTMKLTPLTRQLMIHVRI